MSGTIQNKDSFLGHVASSLGRDRIRNVSKPQWKNRPQWDVLKDLTKDELVDVLKKRCENIHTDVVEVTKDGVAYALEKIITDFGGGTVVSWDDPRFDEYGLTPVVGQGIETDLYRTHVWNPSIGDENLKISADANVGITFSDITLAESGTVVLFSSKEKGRAVSLLPATYVAIVPKSTLVPRMTQAAHMIQEKVDRGDQVASCVNFISGPSNSADIEMNLIVGVHGPIKATYIIVTDS